MRRLASLLALIVLTACPTGGTSGAGPEPSSTSAPTTASTIDGLAGWRWLVFASRHGDEVVVSRRPLGPGHAEVLFSYRDAHGAGAPDVVVSPDGRLVGYTVGRLQVRVRDLGSGRDEVLVSGQRRETPPGADVAAPRWSVDAMNLPAADQKDCPECGILAVATPRFSPSGQRVAFGQRFYEGQNWGIVDRATDRYYTTGESGGALFWKNDDEIITIGMFYADDAEVRQAAIEQLPASRVVVEEHRLLHGSLSPTGHQVVVISDDPTEPAATGLRVSVAPITGETMTRIDSSTREKLTAGFTGNQTPVWVERRGLSASLARRGAQPTPLPDDLYSFGPITPTGPDQIGMAGERRPDCSKVPEPCQGAAPPFERRYLLVNVDGTVVWQSPGVDANSSFAGLTR